MALQSSGAISLANIAAEFGGSTPHSMSEYRGVDTTPATGPISFNDFYGTSAFTVSLNWGHLSVVSSATATCRVRILTDGDVTLQGGSPGSENWGWPHGASAGDGYQVRMDHNSGSAISGTSVNQWHWINATRTWDVVSSAGAKTANVTLRIRLGTGADLASLTFNMTAEKLSF